MCQTFGICFKPMFLIALNSFKEFIDTRNFHQLRKKIELKINKCFCHAYWENEIFGSLRLLELPSFWFVKNPNVWSCQCLKTWEFGSKSWNWNLWKQIATQNHKGGKLVPPKRFSFLSDNERSGHKRVGEGVFLHVRPLQLLTYYIAGDNAIIPVSSAF